MTIEKDVIINLKVQRPRDGAAFADAKGLRHVRGEQLRLHNDGKHRGHNRSP